MKPQHSIAYYTPNSTTVPGGSLQDRSSRESEYPGRLLEVQSVLLQAVFLVQERVLARCIILSIASHVAWF